MRMENEVDDSTSTVRKTSALKIVTILESESNAHGVSKIAKAKSNERKLFWFILVVLGSTVASIQVGFLLKKYFSYPTVEVSNRSRKVHVTFPSVTVCNNNPISMPRLNKLLETTDIFSWFMFLQNANLGEQESRLNSHQAFYENLPEAAQHIGHSYDETVLSCRFKGADCGSHNFSLHFDGKDYYNCFTFTHSENVTSSGNSLPNNPGIHNGLSLILSLEKASAPPGTYGIYDMKNPLAFSNGIRAQIHSHNTMPAPFYHGFDVPPGYSTSVGLKALAYERLPQPYGDCATESLNQQKYENTVSTCLQQCQQKILIKVCGCKTSALPVFHTQGKTIPFCMEIKNWKSKLDLYNDTDKTELKALICEQKVMENLSNDRRYENTCGCSEPCKELSYEQSVSMSYWPEEFYQLNFLVELYKNSGKPTDLHVVQEALDILNTTSNKYGNLAMLGINEQFNKSDKIEIARASSIIRQNFLRLNVYFQDFTVKEHIQIPTYDLSSLLTDIGYTLIIWMGVSVLTLMEVFELIMALVLHVFNSDRYVIGHKKQKRQA